MALLSDPQAWLSFLTLVVLEIVLGFDNIILLALLVERLPKTQHKSARLLGLTFAMLTRIGLLFSVVWLTTLRATLFAIFGHPISGRSLILAAGGLFLALMSIVEIRETVQGDTAQRKPGVMSGFWLIIAQIGLIDILFSLDTVFTAVGLAKQIEVMIAAIVVSALAMMLVSTAVSSLIERYPTVKVVALAFLVLVGGAMIAESMDWEVPQGYLYFAMAFSAVVEWINLRLRRGAGR